MEQNAQQNAMEDKRTHHFNELPTPQLDDELRVSVDDARVHRSESVGSSSKLTAVTVGAQRAAVEHALETWKCGLLLVVGAFSNHSVLLHFLFAVT